MEMSVVTPEETFEKGKKTALYRRWILNEWADLAPGEVELTRAEEADVRAFLKELPREDLPGAVAILAFTLIDSDLAFQAKLASVRRMFLRDRPR